MKIDNEDINVSVDMKIKEGKTSVDDMIPKKEITASYMGQ